MTDKVKREKDDLTEEELDFIRGVNVEKIKGKCPDCKTTKLKEGSEKEIYHCPKCLSTFRLVFSFSFDFAQVVWGHRIPEKK